MTPGQLAYEAYVENVPGPARDAAKDGMPWEKLSPAVQNAWEAAARAVQAKPSPEAA